MSNHTAGPWRHEVYGRGTGDTRFYIETADNTHGICAIRPTDTASSLLSLDEHEANARLIAASPELLALIEPFVAIWNKGCRGYERRMSDYWSYGRLCEARELISKIKGVQHNEHTSS